MIGQEFDEDARVTMAIALERACLKLTQVQDNYETRKFVAERILAAAREGRLLLPQLVEAGEAAVAELPPDQWPG